MSLSTYKGIRAGHLAERRKRAPTLTQAELLQAYFQLARTYKLQFINYDGKDGIYREGGLLAGKPVNLLCSRNGVFLFYFSLRAESGRIFAVHV